MAMNTNKGILLKTVSIILVGMLFICPASVLLREDVPVRYDSAAPVLAQGFAIIGLVLMVIGIIRLILFVRKQV